MVDHLFFGHIEGDLSIVMGAGSAALRPVLRGDAHTDVLPPLGGGELEVVDFFREIPQFPLNLGILLQFWMGKL